MPDLETAELAYDNGRYSTAQTICDSIVNSVGFDSLGVDRLCRLALLYSRLAEHHGDEEANTAQAAHCFETALSVNADSTLMFMAGAPVEEQARLALISAINEGRKVPIRPDTLDYEP